MPDQTVQRGRAQVRRRAAVLLLVVAGAHSSVWRHPAPVHGDEDRFAAGVRYVRGLVGAEAAADREAGAVRAYPVHHPGYPLWVVLGTLLHLTGVEPYSALAVWSLAASCVEPLVVYRLAARLCGDGCAWWLGLGAGLCPLAWFHSTTALNYTMASALGSTAVYAYWCAARDAPPTARHRAANVPPLGMVAAAAGIGVRPDLSIWVGPVIVWLAFQRSRRSGAWTIAGVVAATAGWSLAAAGLYHGGVGDAVSPGLAHTIDVVLGTSVFRLGLVDGLARNTVKLAAVLAWGIGPALVAAFAAAVAARKLWEQERQTAMGLLLWLAPAMLFNAAVHMTEPGHAHWHLAPLWIAAGLGLARWAPRRAPATAALLALSAAAPFAFYPWSAESSGLKRRLDAKVTYLSRRGLLHIDQRARIHAPGDFWRTRAHERPQ